MVMEVNLMNVMVFLKILMGNGVVNKLEKKE